jgi:hypothetical protein
MALTAAEKQRRYRDRRKVTRVTETEQSVTEPSVTVTGPLDVYSESRWSFLQSRGHVWDPDRQRSFRPDGVMGVTVPGDPGYRTTLTPGKVYPCEPF